MKPFFIVCCLFIASSAFAQKTGLGVSLGNPTGVNGKHWLTGDTAVDGGLGFSFGNNTDFSIHSDYLFHKKSSFFFNDVHALDLYFGIGGRMEFSDDIELGVRVPVGLVHELKEQNADIFGEVAPILDFVGRTGIELGLLAGARYYF